VARHSALVPSLWEDTIRSLTIRGDAADRDAPTSSLRGQARDACRAAAPRSGCGCATARQCGCRARGPTATEIHHNTSPPASSPPLRCLISAMRYALGTEASWPVAARWSPRAGRTRYVRSPSRGDAADRDAPTSFTAGQPLDGMSRGPRADRGRGSRWGSRRKRRCEGPSSTEIHRHGRHLHRRCAARCSISSTHCAPGIGTEAVTARWSPPTRRTTMPRQISLDLCGDRLRALWSQLLERCRREAVAIWVQLIASTARGSSNTHEGKEENDDCVR